MLDKLPGAATRGLEDRALTAGPRIARDYSACQRIHSPSPPALTRVLETALYVDDLAVARRFYVDTLGGAVLLDTPRLLALSINAPSVLLLFKRGATT